LLKKFEFHLPKV